MTLEGALAESERRIALYRIHIEQRLAAEGGLNDFALDDDDRSDPVKPDLWTR